MQERPPTMAVSQSRAQRAVQATCMAAAEDEGEIDDRQGVAVAFEDEDEDAEGIVDEILEDSSEDEDGDDDDSSESSIEVF